MSSGSEKRQSDSRHTSGYGYDNINIVRNGFVINALAQKLTGFI